MMNESVIKRAIDFVLNELTTYFAFGLLVNFADRSCRTNKLDESPVFN